MNYYDRIYLLANGGFRRCQKRMSFGRFRPRAVGRFVPIAAIRTCGQNDELSSRAVHLLQLTCARPFISSHETAAYLLELARWSYPYSRDELAPETSVLKAHSDLLLSYLRGRDTQGPEDFSATKYP